MSGYGCWFKRRRNTFESVDPPSVPLMNRSVSLYVVNA
jgi:hypothetical protein